MDYKVSTNKASKNCVSQGTAYTSSDIDYTVKVEAKNLKTCTQYCDLQLLLIFRHDLTVITDYHSEFATRTIRAQFAKQRPHPAGGTKSKRRLRLQCAHAAITHSVFSTHTEVRKDSVDYVIRLDDYIYGYKNGTTDGFTVLAEFPCQIARFTRYTITVRDFATYRTDLDLLLSHQQFPWIPLWDDHGKTTFLC